MTKFGRKLEKVNAQLERGRILGTLVADPTNPPVARFNEGALDGGEVDAVPIPEGLEHDTEGYRERDEKVIRHISESGDNYSPADGREYAQQLRAHHDKARVVEIDSIGHLSHDFAPQPDRSHKAVRARKAQQKKLAKFYRNQHHIARHMP